MGKIVRNGVEYGGSSNSAETIKYNETKNVKDAINEIKSKAMFIDSFDTDTGTLNTTSVSSSNNPTASSVTFNNTDTGLNATNVQDAVTEVNGKLRVIDFIIPSTTNNYVKCYHDESLFGKYIICNITVYDGNAYTTWNTTAVTSFKIANDGLYIFIPNGSGIVGLQAKAILTAI